MFTIILTTLRIPSMIASTLIGERKCESLVGTNQNSLKHVNIMSIRNFRLVLDNAGTSSKLVPASENSECSRNANLTAIALKFLKYSGK